MNIAKILSCTMACIFISAFAQATELTSTPIVDLKLGPEDQKIVAITQYSNGCYEPWLNLKGLKNKRLVIVHLAEKAQGFCTEAIEFRQLNFNIKAVDEGRYQVIDGSNGEKLATLVVDEQNKRLVE